jgi:hypothetical protein
MGQWFPFMVEPQAPHRITVQKMLEVYEVFSHPCLPNQATENFIPSCLYLVEPSLPTQPNPCPYHASPFFDHTTRRGQVDLVDYQAVPDGNYKYLLTYVDHGTKFAYVRALRSKRAAEIGFTLFDIFTTIGPPSILQADNGREFFGAAVTYSKAKAHIDDNVCTFHFIS